jgi:cyclopropane fatty-acyl-phospholipid synthase-like methyltransferase
MTESRSAAHFQRIYDANPDPWGFGTRPYEQEKYRRTLQALGDRRFAAGLEVGCSIGFLTRMLAPHCDSLLGIDLVEQPLQAARARCADQRHVRFQQVQVPKEWPDGRFDLIVLSEVLYFLTAADIDWCASRVRSCLLSDPVVILVNWLGQSDDPTPGDEAAQRFINTATGSLRDSHQDRRPGYRLDVLVSI